MGLAAAVAVAQPAPTRLALAAAPATVSGRIKGYDGADYVFAAKAGQSVRIELKTPNRFAYFNLTAPGADTALFIGSMSGSRFAGALPKAGDYRITVYLMRNAARRNEEADFSLTIGADAPR